MTNNIVFRNHRQIAVWLIISALLVFAMILLGGVTRLTVSGLSIVKWDLLMGVFPPMGEVQWQETFDQYKQFPEYQKVNQGMTVSGFKSIFMYEYLHRLLGRFIGLFYLLPLIYFTMRKKIPEGMAVKLWLGFILIGLQGLLGWYMVKSGLVDIPRVSQYRLTAHLGLAVVIYAYFLWLAFGLLLGRRFEIDQSKALVLKKPAIALTSIIFLMILSGAMVAGLDAGFAYNTFPLMDGRFFPVGLFNLTPAWLSIFEDPTTVQFNHRILAYFIIFLVAAFAVLVLRQQTSSLLRKAIYCLLTVLVLQITLGITTLLLVIPVLLAAAHQGGAIALLTAMLFVNFLIYRSVKV